MNRIILILGIITGLPIISGCETIQAMTENEVVEENNNAISIHEAQPECTKIPLMADLTRSYTNRIYIVFERKLNIPFKINMI